jgi:hypothetical protein
MCSYLYCAWLAYLHHNTVQPVLEGTLTTVPWVFAVAAVAAHPQEVAALAGANIFHLALSQHRDPSAEAGCIMLLLLQLRCTPSGISWRAAMHKPKPAITDSTCCNVVSHSQ